MYYCNLRRTVQNPITLTTTSHYQCGHLRHTKKVVAVLTYIIRGLRDHSSHHYGTMRPIDYSSLQQNNPEYENLPAAAEIRKFWYRTQQRPVIYSRRGPPLSLFFCKRVWCPHTKTRNRCSSINRPARDFTGTHPLHFPQLNESHTLRPANDVEFNKIGVLLAPHDQHGLLICGCLS